MRAFVVFLFLCYTIIGFAQIHPPQLVIQLVIDQLRGDLLERHKDKFGAKGFNYLLSHGINYANTHHPHAHTVTCVGHATIATGSFPNLHGIIGNHWFDRESKKTVNCVEDKKSAILINYRTKKNMPGRSPLHLMVSTLSDEIILAQRGRAFSVSFKDRAAITLAGHAGKAFWFDRKNGGFITSHYYYNAYPQWVSRWNTQYKAAPLSWYLTRPTKNYYFISAPMVKNPFLEFNLTFPHHADPSSQNYYKFLKMSPIADELTVDFALSLLKNERLGQSKKHTDYLAISFSAVDAIGHQFGPNSLESEDNLLRLDNTIAKLLQAIEDSIGLDNTLIVLTADHGVSDGPSYLTSHHLGEEPLAGLSEIKQVIREALVKQFSLPPNTLENVSPPFIYFNHDIIAHSPVSLTQVNNYMAKVLREIPGGYFVYSLSSKIEQDWLGRKVARMVFAKRTGDLYLIPPSHQTLENAPFQRVSHGSPWTYDSYVPLLFVHPYFKKQTISRAVNTTAIAPTLAAILAIKGPSAAVGPILSEVFEHFR